MQSVISEGVLNLDDPSKWADLSEIRDQINRVVFPVESYRSPLPFLTC